MLARLKRWLIGAPRDIRDPRLFQKVSLVAFMAWAGLGADGLSSSAYGPDDAFRALGEHRELAVFLALATAATVFVISYAYSRIIEHFPTGGGGYVVATKLLGKPFGVVSGCALLVDYVLTISVSIAAGADQVFSLLPLPLHAWKVPFEALAIGLLIVMNLRGVKESVRLLMPVFLFFVATHVVLLAGAFLLNAGRIPEVAAEVQGGLRTSLAALGWVGLFQVCAKAYAQGAGTYTGIEAVSNGVQIMREPKVRTAQRTMLYMAISLAVTAGGILLLYTLLGVRPEEGKTLNAVLVERVGFGPGFVIAVLVAEAALLVVAAQTGFIDGPRVMANMALDSWFPHRFSSLSDRLTTHYGIVLIGGSALATLALTRGSTDALVTMYSINVFVTFTLTEVGMCRFWIAGRRSHPAWWRHLPVHAVGLVLCGAILVLQVAEKFDAGGRETAVITLTLILLCLLIHAYYRGVRAKLALISADKLAPESLVSDRALRENPAELDRSKRTAVLLVGDYNGLGVHSVLTLWRMFPGDFPQIVFVSVGILDSGNFKGREEVDRLEAGTRQALDRYVTLANRMGMAAAGRLALGTDAAEECETLCLGLTREFPRATFFAGKLVFKRERWFHWLFHNQTAHAVQRRLEWEGIPMIVLPARVRD